MIIKYKYGSPCAINGVANWQFDFFGEINVDENTDVFSILNVLGSEIQKNIDLKELCIDDDKIKSMEPCCFWNTIGIYSDKYAETMLIEDGHKKFFQLLNYLEVQDEVKFVRVGGLGGCVGKNDNPYFEIYINSNENTGHHLPHALIRHQDGEANYNILTVKRINGVFYKRKIDKAIVKYISKNQEMLIRHWNDHSNGIKVPYYKVSIKNPEVSELEVEPFSTFV